MGVPKLVLLPPLKAPNDPQVVEEQERQRREIQKKKLAFQKQNAEASLSQFIVPPMPPPGKRRPKMRPKPKFRPRPIAKVAPIPATIDVTETEEEEQQAEEVDENEENDEPVLSTQEVTAFADSLASITAMAAGADDDDPSVLNLTEVKDSQDPQSD
jgi:hypothetical protein